MLLIMDWINVNVYIRVYNLQILVIKEDEETHETIYFEQRLIFVNMYSKCMWYTVWIYNAMEFTLDNSKQMFECDN